LSRQEADLSGYMGQGMEYPTGIVTFMLTDIEGSTRLWDEAPQFMRAAMLRHDEIVENAVAGHAGLVVRPRGEGDSRFAVFEQPGDAVRAAAKIQRELQAVFAGKAQPVRVRIGIHVGAAEWRAGDYYGSTINRCARLRGLGHGGQTLLSQAATELVRDDLANGMELVNLGTFSLRGLSRPETVYQLWLPDLPNEFPALVEDDGTPTNLPEPATPIIGRAVERRQVEALLLEESVRVVTLTGPGGMGKTRLSLELGHALLDHYPDGIFFVDLAPIVDPALVASTIGQTMGIREGGGRPPLDNLKDYLANRRMLLILDNMEQVIDAAPHVAELLRVTPQVKLLVTSRIPLQIRGEREYPLATLTLPPDGAIAPTAELLSYEAVSLFVRQAQAVRPTFELTAENAAAVVAICRRLDGLPLALEIAASRVRLLPPPALLKRLDASLSLLVGWAADLPARQQTMRGTIDWSYDLLEPDEQSLYARLGVFVGGFTIETAEAVCNQDGTLDVVAGLETLLTNSLLRQVESAGDEPRFDMLQTIRDYALEKLAAAGELAARRMAHANHFFDYSFPAWNVIYGPRAVPEMERLEEEHDNFRAAISWSLEEGHDVLVAARLAIFLLWFWYRHGHMQEGRELSERIMRATEPIGGLPHAMGLNAAGMMAMWQGDLDVANDRISAALQLSTENQFDLGVAMGNFSYGINLINQGRDREGHTHLIQAGELFDEWQSHWDMATTTIHLANAALGMGEVDESERWLRRALPLAEQVGDPWQIAFALNNLGEVARTRGDYESARQYYTRSEEVYRQADAVGDHARLIHTLGYLALHDDDEMEAARLFHESLSAYRTLGNKRGIAECLAGLAALAAARGNWQQGTLLLSAAEAQMALSNAAWWPADRGEIAQTHRTLEAGLGGDFDSTWELGRHLTLAEAIAAALPAGDH
jgi:predicted ATPase/Tfp pilus assembly protein PilF